MELALNVLKVVTRGSQLAVVETESTMNYLLGLYPSLRYEIVLFNTIGDRHRYSWEQFAKTTTDEVRRRKWTYELEMAIVDRTVDLAVHCAKDMPYNVLPQTVTFPVCTRDDPRDVFIGLHVKNFADLPHGAVIGTNSPRRKAQLLRLRPDLNIVPYSGNVTTRMDPAVMAERKVDGCVIAAAGLKRLGMLDCVSSYFDTSQMLPAVTQGILCVQMHEELAPDLTDLMHKAVDPATAAAFYAERAVTEGLCASCETAVAALATVQGDHMHLQAQALAPNGAQEITVEVEGPIEQARELGLAAAKQLLAAGADAIMRVAA